MKLFSSSAAALLALLAASTAVVDAFAPLSAKNQAAITRLQVTPEEDLALTLEVIMDKKSSGKGNNQSLTKESLEFVEDADEVDEEAEEGLDSTLRTSTEGPPEFREKTN